MGSQRHAGTHAQSLLPIVSRQNILSVRIGEGQDSQINHREGEFTFHWLTLWVCNLDLEGYLIAVAGPIGGSGQVLVRGAFMGGNIQF